MELDRYLELRLLLQRWRMLVAESIRHRIEASPRLTRRVERIYNSEGTDEPLTVWLDRWCRQAAIQFILRILFLRVLEDRDLLGATRLRSVDGQRMWQQLTRNLGAARYVQFCFWDAAHLLPDLFEPNDYDLALPADDLVQRFLDDVWRRQDADHSGWLRFDFRSDTARGDAGFQTRFIGDLYQELDPEIRERYALLQTPDFIAQFILENTLLKRFEEMDFREVTLMDPTCGSGHFEVDAFWMFVARYESAAGKTREQMTAAERTQIARAIIEKHLFGCDINPYATALTRFRLVLAASDYAHPASMRDFRDLRFNIVTIDSLIPYEKLLAGGVQAGTAAARALGQPEAIERALPVLRRRYHVVVGNPPYIVAQDAMKRDLYRTQYVSAHSKFGLSAPFTERFLNLATDGGRVGLINSNAFARRQFGSKLIEDVLPKYDLQAVIDLSGAHVPNHSTPTLILYALNRPPSTDALLVLSNLKGEPRTPADAAQGEVWQSVLCGFRAGVGYVDEYVDVTSRTRDQMAIHPWQFGGEENRCYQRILSSASVPVGQLVSFVGCDIVIIADNLYTLSSDSARRLHLPTELLREMVIGEDIRDWSFDRGHYSLFPYVERKPIDIRRYQSVLRYLLPYKSYLEGRQWFGKSIVERGMNWYEYAMISWSRRSGVPTLAYPIITTHNHFCTVSAEAVAKNTVIRVIPKQNGEYSAELFLALLNTNLHCFYLKRKCFNKKPGNDRVRDNYVFDAKHVLDFVFPVRSLSSGHLHLNVLAGEVTGLSGELPALSTSKLFERVGEAYHAWNRALDGYVSPHPKLPPPFATTRELRTAREQLTALRHNIRGRMIFLQEEMDWLAYEMYGLIKKAPLAEDYLSPLQYKDARLELGQRPFELAGKGYTGDWPPDYQPAPLPDYLRPLADARIALIHGNPDIALLEDPLYKRRWVPPDYDKEFREAAAWWLAEKLEWALEQAGRPLSLAEWARPMGQDERVNAALEVLTGTPTFDIEEELRKVIRANAVPNRPEHYLKASGLRKLYAALVERRRTNDDRPPPVPQYSREDFADATAWRLRGKLNIPRERFIYYAEFDVSRGNGNAPESGGPWFGWAGWDAAQRADAQAHLLDRAQRSGWDVRWRQCGLRAALRDLLPDLKDLPPSDRAEFEAIAGICGISLTTTCYCQPYRDAFARGEAGVPGVGEEALGVKVVLQEEDARRPGGRGRKKKGETAEQMRWEI